MITLAHMERSKERTGKRWTKLHEWLDNCNTSPFIDNDEYPMQHRVERHTPSGLRYVLSRWGVSGLKEAMYHLKEDGINVFSVEFLTEKG